MNKPILGRALSFLIPFFVFTCYSYAGAISSSPSAPLTQQNTNNVASAMDDTSIFSGILQDRYTLIAWNDLGMHCIDHSFSVFAILPPYNNLHAQLMDRLTSKLVNTGVTISYQATADTRGSLNTTSIGKTDFWSWVAPLFGTPLSSDMGLAGNPVPGIVPAAMAYDTTHNYWKAEGIPIVPYDDSGITNYYPMVKVVAKNSRGKVLASTTTVLPVSDELACDHCHTSGTGDPMAQPSPDWVYDQNPDKDWKRNILLLHDNKNTDKALYISALAQNGYSAAGLLSTADAGKPILCANCHPSNALGKAGIAGIKQLTTSMHSWHAVNAMDDNTGMPLDLTMDRTGCYYCHPGSTTQCLRGVMGIATNPDGTAKLECQSCHGAMSNVGSLERNGWIDVPKCQNCHYQAPDGTYVQDVSALDSTGNFRQAFSRFSTGSALYKVGITHGNLQCEACHGSTHAEYATSEANDNAQSIAVQGHSGTIAECNACHVAPLVITDSKGPHGLHTIGQIRVLTHAKAAKDTKQCIACHGNDFRGTKLSRTFAPRSYYSYGPKVKYAQGQMVSCFDCHKKVGSRWLPNP